MTSLTEWQTLDPSRVNKAVTVMVPMEWYVNGEAYYAMTTLPSVEAENLGILTRKERKMVDGGLERLVRHDETLWSSSRGSRPPLPTGCRAFLLVLFSSMFFLGQLARDLNVSVSFSENQTHEARTQGDTENLNAQMERDSLWIVVYRFPAHTRHSSKLGHRQTQPKQRDEFEAQIQWLILSVRQRLAKGCLVLVEGTWFNEQRVLSELSRTADSVTGESFEVLRGVSPQLDTTWGTASARMKMVLEAESQHQTPIWERLIAAALEEAADRNAYTAYPGEVHQEDVVERGPIDDPTGDSGQPVPGTELPEAEEMEQEELDQFVLPGMTDAEQLRKKKWLRIPRQARQALRRLHHMLDHKPKAVMRQVLKAGGAPPEQLAGVELFHCDKCDEAVPPLRLHSVKAPARYTFNHEVLIDVLEAKDVTGERFSFLSIVCNGTLFHVVVMVRPGGGTPSSRKCAAKFAASWVAWAGWPVCVTCDRGLHNRRVFAQALSAHGVYLRTAGVEAAERHGGILKHNLSLVVSACGIKGKAAMKMAAATCVSAKNELVRQGGIAPNQWVLGKFPRGVGHMLEEEELGQLGVLEHQTDSATEFGMRAK